MREKVKKRHVELKDHIGIYDGYIPDMECDKAIQYFEKQMVNCCVCRKDYVIFEIDHQWQGGALCLGLRCVPCISIDIAIGEIIP